MSAALGMRLATAHTMSRLSLRAMPLQHTAAGACLAGVSALVPTVSVPAVAACCPMGVAVRRFSSNNDANHHRQPTSRVSSALDYYALLEVHRHQLRDGDLKQAYYRLAKQYHPDRLVHMPNSDRDRAEKRFATITTAYHVLSDPLRRQQYDIFMDLSSVGDQDRMLHWVKINRPPDQLGFEGFKPAYDGGYEQSSTSTAATAAAIPTTVDATAAAIPTTVDATTPTKSSKPKPAMPVFRSS